MPEEKEKPKIGDELVVSINKFAAGIKPELMLALTEKLGVSIDREAVKKRRKEIAQTVVEAVASLDVSRQEEIGRQFEDLRTIGMERKNNLVMVSFCKNNGITMPEKFAETNGLEKVAWCFVTFTGDKWEALKTQTFIESFKHWRGYNLAFREDPEPGLIKKHKKDLEKAVGEWVFNREYRGKNCESECYSVGDREYIVFLLTDYQDSGRFWSGERAKYVTLDETNLAPSFYIVVTFNVATFRMNVLFPTARNNNSQACRGICELVCDTAFGKGACKKEAVKYDLSSLLQVSELPYVQDSGIVKAQIVRVEISLDPNGERTRSYGEKDGDIHERIRAELTALRDQVPEEDIKVRRGQIRFTYKLSDGKEHKRTVELSNSSSTIASATSETQKLINAYLAHESVGILSDENNQENDG